MRICLFTDTLGDINGVSRFIRNIAALSEQSPPRDLYILTSTRLPIPARPNIFNIRPRLACPMPGYPQLELALPPLLAMMHRARHLKPDAVHISTPGPVGLTGLAIARVLRIPALGVYHTDFPEYVARLFDDPAFDRVSTLSMQMIYRRFARIFTRSEDYAIRLQRLGISGDRLVHLRPGIDTSSFGPAFADPQIWNSSGLFQQPSCSLPLHPPIPASAPKVLYVGRVSVEKDLPLLMHAWQRIRALRRQSSTPPTTPPPQLIIVGDGPYRAEMQRELGGDDVHFLGFRSGAELAAIYASSDLFAFPSTTDTLGQVVMEAQASGLPVLVSDCGGPREVVQHGTTGLVLPAPQTMGADRAGAGPGAAAAWAHAILNLLDDAPRRRRMGDAAHRAMQPMSIRASFEHFWMVHEEVVRAHQLTNPARQQTARAKLVT